MCSWQFFSGAVFSPLKYFFSCLHCSPLSSLPARRPGTHPSARFSLCYPLAVFQSPSPGSSSPLGAESSSTPLHPSDPAEASTNKEVGGMPFCFKSPFSCILILACAFSSLPQSFCPKAPWADQFCFLLSSVQFDDESRHIQFGSR